MFSAEHEPKVILQSARRRDDRLLECLLPERILEGFLNYIKVTDCFRISENAFEPLGRCFERRGQRSELDEQILCPTLCFQLRDGGEDGLQERSGPLRFTRFEWRAVPMAIAASTR